MLAPQQHKFICGHRWLTYSNVNIKQEEAGLGYPVVCDFTYSVPCAACLTDLIQTQCK